MPVSFQRPITPRLAQRPNYCILHEAIASMKRDREEIRLTIEQSHQMIADTRRALAKTNALLCWR